MIKVTVLTKGNLAASINGINNGGHTFPIAEDGVKLEWKKAQKKPKNNKASEMINKAIPHNKPLRTIGEWANS